MCPFSETVDDTTKNNRWLQPIESGGIIWRQISQHNQVIETATNMSLSQCAGSLMKIGGLQFINRAWIKTSIAVIVISVVFSYFIEHWIGLETYTPRTNRQIEHSCYGEYGCFSNAEPFNHLPLPMSLDRINISFNILIKSSLQSSLSTSSPRQQLSYTYQSIPDGSMYSHFDKNKHTKIIIHGYYVNTHQVTKLTNTLLEKKEWNLIYVDWYNGLSYVNAASNVRLVGAVTAHWIQMLEEQLGYSKPKIHCVGIGVGAHACGFAGKHLLTQEKGAIHRITGLDPAGVGYLKQPITGRLDSSDAEYVDVIHTDLPKGLGWLNLGTTDAIGHVDIYVNGGGPQPHCSIHQLWNSEFTVYDVLTSWMTCHHMRAVELYTESVVTDCTHKPIACKDLQHITQDGCEELLGHQSKNVQLLGENSMKYSGQGIFYLRTNIQPPYCL